MPTPLSGFRQPEDLAVAAEPIFSLLETVVLHGPAPLAAQVTCRMTFVAV